MADPVTATPEEVRAPGAPPPSARALDLLWRPGFRRLYLAVVASELGDAFQYIALMWAALLAGGPLGVIAVRLADSVPALVFGFHGGLVADRAGRRRLMVTADLARAYALLAFAHSLGPAMAGALAAGAGQGSAYVLTLSAAQTDIPDAYLGRVTGLISLVHRGAHATGLLLVSPLFAVFAARSVFAAAALAIPLVGLASAAVAARATQPPR